MKKLTIASCIIFGCFETTAAQSKDFRDFFWGNSLNMVESLEKNHLISKVSNDELVYSDELGGSETNVYYIFNDNDKLESGMYIMTKKYSNPQLYFQDYNKFKKLLEEKYGKPASEDTTWFNGSKEVEKNSYGQALANGNLILTSVWNTSRSVVKIELVNTGDRHPSLQIHYTTKSLDELENKDNLKAALKKL